MVRLRPTNDRIISYTRLAQPQSKIVEVADQDFMKFTATYAIRRMGLVGQFLPLDG